MGTSGDLTQGGCDLTLQSVKESSFRMENGFEYAKAPGQPVFAYYLFVGQMRTKRACR